LRIVRRFLEAGLMQDGVCIERHEGTPQGGPLSPLLANLLLDDLDKELERRGHRCARYCEDFLLVGHSQRAGARVKASLTRFLRQQLKLESTESKSTGGPTNECTFLGFTFHGPRI
jgi:RNA-directed DNA polymerase